jgi:hypothetical protein
MRSIHVALVFSLLPVSALAEYCNPGSLLSHTDGLYLEMAAKYASSRACPASLMPKRTACDELKPPPLAAEGSTVPSSSLGPGPGCKAEYTVSHRKADGLSYTVYDTAEGAISPASATRPLRRREPGHRALKRLAAL